MANTNSIIQSVEHIKIQAQNDLIHIDQNIGQISQLDELKRIVLTGTTAQAVIDREKTARIWSDIQSYREMLAILENQQKEQLQQAAQLLAENENLPEGKTVQDIAGNSEINLSVKEEVRNAMKPFLTPAAGQDQTDQEITDEEIDTFINSLPENTPEGHGTIQWAADEIKNISAETDKAKKIETLKGIAAKLQKQHEASQIISQVRYTQAAIDGKDIDIPSVALPKVPTIQSLLDKKASYDSILKMIQAFEQSDKAEDAPIKDIIQKAKEANTPAAIDLVMALLSNIEEGKTYDAAELAKIYNQIEAQLPKEVSSVQSAEVENKAFEDALSKLPAQTPAPDNTATTQIDQVVQTWQTLQDYDNQLKELKNASITLLDAARALLQGNHPYFPKDDNPFNGGTVDLSKVPEDLSVPPEILTAFKPYLEDNADVSLDAIQNLSTVMGELPKQVAWLEAEMTKAAQIGGDDEAAIAEKRQAYKNIANALQAQNDADKHLKNHRALEKIIASEEYEIPNGVELGETQINLITQLKDTHTKKADAKTKLDTFQTQLPDGDLKTAINEALGSDDAERIALVTALVANAPEGTDHAALLKQINDAQASFAKGPESQEDKKTLLDKALNPTPQNDGATADDTTATAAPAPVAVDTAKMAEEWQRIQDYNNAQKVIENAKNAHFAAAAEKLADNVNMEGVANVQDITADLAVKEEVRNAMTPFLTPVDGQDQTDQEITDEEIDAFINSLPENTPEGHGTIQWAADEIKNISAETDKAKKIETLKGIAAKLQKQHEASEEIIKARQLDAIQKGAALPDGMDTENEPGKSAAHLFANKVQFDTLNARFTTVKEDAALKDKIAEILNGNNQRLKDYSVALLGSTQDGYDANTLLQQLEKVEKEMLVRPTDEAAKKTFLETIIPATNAIPRNTNRAEEIKKVWQNVRNYSAAKTKLKEAADKKFEDAKKLLEGNERRDTLLAEIASEDFAQNREKIKSSFEVTPDVLNAANKLADTQNNSAPDSNGGDAPQDASDAAPATLTDADYTAFTTALNADTTEQLAWARTQLQEVENSGKSDEEKHKEYQEIAKRIHGQAEAYKQLNEYVDLQEIMKNDAQTTPANTTLNDDLQNTVNQLHESTEARKAAQKRCDDVYNADDTNEDIKNMIDEARNSENPALNDAVLALIGNTKEGEALNHEELLNLYNAYKDGLPKGLSNEFNEEAKKALLPEQTGSLDEETEKLVTPEITKAWRTLNESYEAFSKVSTASGYHFKKAEVLLKNNPYCKDNEWVDGTRIDYYAELAQKLPIKKSILDATNVMLDEEYEPNEKEINQFVKAIENDNSEGLKWARDFVKKIKEAKLDDAIALQNYTQVALHIRNQAEAAKLVKESVELNRVIEPGSNYTLPEDTTLDADTLNAVKQYQKQEEANKIRQRYNEIYQNLEQTDPEAKKRLDEIIGQLQENANFSTINLLIAAVAATEQGQKVDIANIEKVYNDISTSTPKDTNIRSTHFQREDLINQALKYAQTKEEKDFLRMLKDEYDCDFSAYLKKDSNLEDIQPSDKISDEWKRVTQNISLENANTKFFSELQERVNEHQKENEPKPLALTTEIVDGNDDGKKKKKKKKNDGKDDDDNEDEDEDEKGKDNDKKKDKKRSPSFSDDGYSGYDPNGGRHYASGTNPETMTEEEKAKEKDKLAQMQQEQQNKESWWSRNMTWILTTLAIIATAGIAFFFIRKYKKDSDKSKNEANTLKTQVSDLQTKISDLSKTGASNNSANESTGATTGIATVNTGSTLANNATIIGDVSSTTTASNTNNTYSR